MIGQPVPGEPYALGDGLGSRRLVNGPDGREDVLDLSPALAGIPAAESVIRATVASHAAVPREWVAGVSRVERRGSALQVVADAPEGIRLSNLLILLEESPGTLPDSGMIALAQIVIEAVSRLHEWPGTLAHGALAASHVVVTADCGIVLTDSVFGSVLESLQLNREQLWKTYSLALPTSAGLSRFDQGADLTQLGALVLAIALRRPLRASEYPRDVPDLVRSTRLDVEQRVLGSPTSALHMWLEEALQLRYRAAFSNAVHAREAFTAVAPEGASRRAGVQALAAWLASAGLDTGKAAGRASGSSHLGGPGLPPGHIDVARHLKSLLRANFPNPRST